MGENLTLNVTSKQAGQKRRQQKPAQTVKKRVKKTEEFDFQFDSEKPKAKAIVVRRKADSTKMGNRNSKVKDKKPIPKAPSSPLTSSATYLDSFRNILPTARPPLYRLRRDEPSITSSNSFNSSPISPSTRAEVQGLLGRQEQSSNRVPTTSSPPASTSSRGPITQVGHPSPRVVTQNFVLKTPKTEPSVKTEGQKMPKTNVSNAKPKRVLKTPKTEPSVETEGQKMPKTNVSNAKPKRMIKTEKDPDQMPSPGARNANIPSEDIVFNVTTPKPAVVELKKANTEGLVKKREEKTPKKSPSSEQPKRVLKTHQSPNQIPSEVVPNAPSPPGDFIFNFSTAKEAAESLLSGDLILNVTTKPVVAVEAKKKVTRAERLGVNKAKGKPMTKLSDEQLSRALKSQLKPVNPNQLPRAGDIFRAQMEEERKQKMREEAGEDEKSSEDDQESVKESTKDLPMEDGNLSSNAGVAQPTQETGKKPSETQSKPKPEESKRVRTKKVGLFDQSDVEALKELGQRAVKPVKETIFTGTKISTLGLHPHAVKNLEDLLGIKELTTVQQKTIPEVLLGKDVLVRSQTGSGKTLAYALPLVELLQKQLPKIKRQDGILALVIVPTRELVVQTYELVQKLVRPYTWIVPGALLGGENRKSEKGRIRKGINLLIGTPGRLVDHLLHTTAFKLNKLQFLILDEADRLLELGYERDVKTLVEAIDKQRAECEDKNQPKLQRLLLSATLTSQVKELAGLTLQNPLYIDNSDEAASAALKSKDGYQKETIETLMAVDDGLGEYQEDVTGVLSIPDNLQLSFLVVPPKLRLVVLSSLLAKEMDSSPKQFKAIIFMSTTEMVNFHHDMLNEALTKRVLDEEDENQEEDSQEEGDPPLLQGLRFFKLHGSMTQTERQGVFRAFRDCPSCVLLATDVVGRGIDVPDTKLVVQYTPPQTTADFVHRVGRTARAGRRGRAVLFLAPSEAQYVRHLEKKRIRIQQGDMYSYLQTLLPKDDEARTVQEAASNLQHKFQSLLEDDRELHDKSCKAFVSWTKFYTTFPKELKPIFNVRVAHMGHFAKSFALKEAPTKFAAQHAAPKAAPPTNRLTYTERDPDKMQAQKREKRRYTTTVSGQVRQVQQQNGGSPVVDRRKPGPQGSGGSGGSGGFGGSGGGVGRSSFLKSMNKSRALNMSEMDSGLPPAGPAKRSKKK
ncbi:probable ATP-dependent RNA helicase CG8611 [Drosophila ficusphila]|uniref:probable ATP-dependent RNA helicase CG8611 n=1 Tax=Drosophila ficusphila TaxID=30025 RepID=UPI0007E65BCF|nr:probable ATP-dependent RNA helicase CG8611 [Drosophila ficusphila]